MAQYIVRVVLHGKNHDHPDYTKLHAAMKSAGFSQVISDSGGNWFHLPPAEYRADTTQTRTQVCNAAKGAANTVTQSNGVLVTEGYCLWDGLIRV
ncbi:type V toxin-antitoxin system endoribonuclease antitoxin GhoS [Burkholderia gladioli]|uniref:type V toxin-antitoxin system endoribonuclease antitoxin GhoS n=1 Tax=Burkholderia gladioli TaxID=28095 RepID=UPI00163F5761|nr:type V toxin-antitoxin system endoribonuclease antitoxin GhoS [Burkholderia gladioli]